MTFCTALNCMDGRIQMAVIKYLQKRFDVKNVDMITEAGIDGLIADGENEIKISSIFERVDISLIAHNSIGIAVIGHADCAGNPVSDEEHIVHIKRSMEYLKKKYENIQIIGLWIDKKLNVNEVGD